MKNIIVIVVLLFVGVVLSNNISFAQEAEQTETIHNEAVNKGDSTVRKKVTIVVDLGPNRFSAEITTTAECDKCKKRLEEAVNRLDGILYSSLDVETRVFSVEFDPEVISIDKIKNVISKTGYDADEMPREESAYRRLPKCCQVGGMD